MVQGDSPVSGGGLFRQPSWGQLKKLILRFQFLEEVLPVDVPLISENAQDCVSGSHIWYDVKS